MSNNAKVGGVLSIVSGAFGFFGLIWAVLSIYMFSFMVSEPFAPYSPYGGGPPEEFLEGFVTVVMVFYAALGLMFALTGALGVVGGIFALRRKRWGLALAGSIAGTITFFPCGIPAIIFVTLARPEFSTPQTYAPVG